MSPSVVGGRWVVAVPPFRQEAVRCFGIDDHFIIDAGLGERFGDLVAVLGRNEGVVLSDQD